MMMAHDTRPYARGWSGEEVRRAQASGREQALEDRANRHERRGVSHAENDAESIAGTTAGTTEHTSPSAARQQPTASRAPSSLLRLLEPLLDACVIGGVTLAPLLSVLGCVGLIFPAQAALHQIATGLLYAAMIWLGFSLAVAHLLRGERQGRRTGGVRRIGAQPENRSTVK